MFGTDKWVERQNQHIEKPFTEVVRKIEPLYRTESAKQVAPAQQNVLTDFGELFQLRNDVKMLAENYDDLKSTFETMFDQMSNHSIRSKIFAIADALICGTLISVSSGGGGGNSFSDLRGNGRRPDEEEEAYRRRCLLNASRVVMIPPQTVLKVSNPTLRECNFRRHLDYCRMLLEYAILSELTGGDVSIFRVEGAPLLLSCHCGHQFIHCS